MLSNASQYVLIYPLLLLAEGVSVDLLPSKSETALIELHAASWDVVLEKERLKVMASRWPDLLDQPDSAAAHFGSMVAVANSIVDRLSLSTGYPRTSLMRWLENDVGVGSYFFPPRPAPRVGSEGGSFWKILAPILPIVLYRVVDRVIQD